MLPWGGKFLVTLIDSNACSSKTHTELLVVKALPTQPMITQTNNQLSSSSASAYQWFFNNSPVNGAVQQKLTITQNGFYYVCIRDMNSCESCSAPFNAVINTVENLVTEENLLVFPNPAQKEINLSGFIFAEKTTIKFVNALGQCVKSININNLIDSKKLLIEIGDLNAGIYFMVLQMDDSILVKKIMIVNEL